MKRNINIVNIGALVISAGNSPAALDIVRALGRERIASAVASSQEDDIAFASKYCVAAIQLLPFEPDTDVENIDRLIMFARNQTVAPVLYYVSDPELAFVRRNRDALAQYLLFNLPPEYILENLFNKVLFSSFAVAHRLPVPTTTVIKDLTELPVVLSSIEFPCIVKPAFSEDWKWDTEEQQQQFGSYKEALKRIRSAEELLKFCTALPLRQSGFLIQSYIEGRDESIYSFHGYFNERSHCLGYFVGRKIRTYPPHTGGSTFIQTIQHPALAEMSIAYLQRINFQGIVKIDFKWDAGAQEFKILEINPRYNLWELLGVFAGINLVSVAYRHQRGIKIIPGPPYHENVRLLYLKQDIRAFIRGYRPMGEWTILRYIVSLLQKNYFRVFDTSDVKPFLFSLYGFFKRILIRSGLFVNEITVPSVRPKTFGNISQVRSPHVYDEALHQ